MFSVFVQLTQFQMELKRKQHVNFDSNNFIFLYVHLFIRLLMLSMSHNPLSFLVRLWEFKRCVFIFRYTRFSLIPGAHRRYLSLSMAWNHTQTHTQIFWMCSTCLTFFFTRFQLYFCLFICLVVFCVFLFIKCYPRNVCVCASIFMLAKDVFFCSQKYNREKNKHK